MKLLNAQSIWFRLILNAWATGYFNILFMLFAVKIAKECYFSIGESLMMKMKDIF